MTHLNPKIITHRHYKPQRAVIQSLFNIQKTPPANPLSRDAANPVYETKYIAVIVYVSLLNGEQAEAKYNTITRLYIVIIYSRSVVFISTFSSLKSELFLKKGGVILSV